MMKKTNVSSIPNDSLLPPCRICGEKASGFHYGVNTCEACKGFFRRSLQRKEEYKCIGNEDCEIEPGKRNACAFCRFKKCLWMGMSKEAIKTGRYTLEKRTKDIQEVKRLKKADSFVLDGSEVMWEMPRDLENLIEKIVNAHKIYGGEWEIEVDLLTKKQQEYHEQYKLKIEVFGGLPAISKEEYESFYHSTGIDLDNRMQMMESYAKLMEESVMRFVNFAKSIPGFKGLSIGDQTNLIKASRFEFWYLGSYRLMNDQLKIAMAHNGLCYHIEEISRLWDREFLEAVFGFSTGLKKLCLSFEETALIRAIIIMSADRCLLEDPQRVEAIQFQLVICLDYLLARNRPSEKHQLAKVFDRLMSLRSLTEWNAKLTDSMKLEWAVFRDNPLLYEMMTI